MSKKHRRTNTKNVKKLIKRYGVTTLFAVFVVYGIFWLVTLPKKPTATVVSENGLHYHTKLVITVNGENIYIPANVGITAARHFPMHTHKDDGVVHMEYGGKVRGTDLTLGKFFDIWGKDFTKSSFMGHPIDDTSEFKMTVNGESVVPSRDYVMRDGDTIEIVYNNG